MTPNENQEIERLEVGMLLLGGLAGAAGEPLDRIWTVAKVNRTAKLVAHYGRMHAVADLNDATLPPGWKILTNSGLAAVAYKALQDPALRRVLEAS